MPTGRENRIQDHPNVKARVLPHNDEAEQAVLGCVLNSDSADEAPITILNELKSDDFYQPAHRDIFGAMQSLWQKDKPVDYITLLQELEESGKTEKAGGLTYITGLSNAIPAASNYAHYLNIVKKTSLLRQLIASSQRIMDAAYSGDAEEDAMGIAEREIYALSEKQDRSTLVNMNEAVDAAMKTIENKKRNPIEQNTVPIPFTKLNEQLGGFHPSDLVLIAARPAQGKTSLGMNFISHAALDKSRRTPAGKVDPFRCAVFSLEMSAEQLATRMLCSVAKVSMEKVKSGNTSQPESMRLTEAQTKLKDAVIYVDDSSLTTPVEILSKCRRLKREQGLDLVLVDYLQLMSSGKRVESRQQEVSDITRTMKIAAKELNVPILLLSQMSRDIEKRTDKKPQMSDLRESGAIEQDADIIIFLYREHDPNDATVDEDARTKCDLIVAKHRNGRTGNVTVRWHGEYTTFTDLYENRVDTAIEQREPHFETHFSGVDDVPPPENGDDGLVAPPPIESYAPPVERGAKRTEKKNEPAEDFSFGDDPFEIPVKKKDDDII